MNEAKALQGEAFGGQSVLEKKGNDLRLGQYSSNMVKVSQEDTI